MRPASCPGCVFSGQPHLEGCQNSKLERDFLTGLNRTHHWKELMKAVFELREDEVPIAAAYINRLIESRPK